MRKDIFPVEVILRARSSLQLVDVRRYPNRRSLIGAVKGGKGGKRKDAKIISVSAGIIVVLWSLPSCGDKNIACFREKILG